MRLPSVVWLLIDGLSQQLLNRLGGGDDFPFLQSCLAQGRTAALAPLAPNCQTPPSLFTIWSGTLPAEHGLTGYDIPCQEGDDPTRFCDGFATWPRAIPMVWDRYAAAGKTIRTSAVPFMQTDKLGAALLSATDVFARPLLAPEVHGDGDVLRLPQLELEWELTRQGDDFIARARGARAGQAHDVAVRLDQTVWLALPTDPARAGGHTHQALGVRCARVDGVPMLINLGYQAVTVRGSDAAARIAAGRDGGFVVANPGKLYHDGRLGRRLDQGGQGGAETLLVDLMHEVHLSFANDFRWALRAGGADLVVLYYPVIDLLSHQILRYALDQHDDTRPGPLAPLFARVLGWLDGLLAEVATLVGSDTTVVAHSDHGMVPLYRQIAPNRFFLEQGVLAVCADTGRIDHQRAMMFLHPAENGLLVWHPERLREAGLSAEAVLARLDGLLLEQGVPPIRLVEGPRAALAEVWQCSHYMQAPPGTRLRAGAAEPLLCDSKKGGDHTVCSDEPWLRGVLIDMSARYQPFAPAATLQLADILSYVVSERSAA
ncbi:MAG: alkaline phosphatase family protein [Pseudomonadota bacterium]